MENGKINRIEAKQKVSENCFFPVPSENISERERFRFGFWFARLGRKGRRGLDFPRDSILPGKYF